MVGLALAARERLLRRREFRRWASAFPLTRSIARREARELFDLCAGFVYSQVLLACVRLGVFEKLSSGPLTLASLASLTSLSPSATERLVRAAQALRLVEARSGGRYGLGPLGAVVAEEPGIVAMIEHHALLYADLADPVALLRERKPGALAACWPYARLERPADLSASDTARYTQLMAASQSLIAEQVLDAYPIARHRRLLDVGGGNGEFLIRAAARAPRLELVLFDLPAVAAAAHQRFVTAGLAARSSAVGGDFLRDPLPTGADALSLIRVVHDHDDAAAAALLRAAYRALAPGGTLLLAEPMAESEGDEPLAAYFGFYLLAMGQGRPRSVLELEALLRGAGFEAVRRVPTGLPLQTSLLTSVKTS